MQQLFSTALLPLLFCCTVAQQNFTISNGQIFTPGYAVVDSPQPGTPLGGSQIEVALDVSANGVLPLDLAEDSPSIIHNITIFMYSYATGRNFTISNGTSINGTCGPIMQQEPGSTVKHVKWTWPSCLAGDGQPTTDDSARGIYNISIRQNFRMNNTDYYTIFDLPISVTNSIDNSTSRSSCDELSNPIMTPEQINADAANWAGVMFSPGSARIVQVRRNDTDDGVSSLGLRGAGVLSWMGGAQWICALAFVVTLLL